MENPEQHKIQGNGQGKGHLYFRLFQHSDFSGFHLEIHSFICFLLIKRHSSMQ